MTKICCIGLGKMGTALATVLLREGLDITVYNRTEKKMLPLIEMGAKGAHSLPEAVKESDIVISCLLDDKAVIECAKEFAPHLRSNAIHISLATILPDTAKQLEAIHQDSGNRFIGGAVLGIPQRALEKKLTTFCSGNQNAIMELEEVLSCFSEKILNLGEQVKAANVMKICMNYSLSTALELMSELYIFAEKSELDTSYVSSGLNEIFGHPAFKLYIEKIASRNFDSVNFDIIGGNKDACLFQEAFKRVGMENKLGEVVRSRFQQAIEKGMEDMDWSSIYEIVRSESGLS